MPKKGDHVSEETKLKIRNARLVKNHTKETKEKISNTRRHVYTDKTNTNIVVME
jgi:hypothetical protein